MKNSNRRWIVYLLTGALLVLGRNGLINGWNLAAGRGFIIPQESNLLSFHATLMNQGSGEWWIYGEDADSFYYFTGVGDVPYRKFPRRQARNCESFEPTDHSTWCID